MNVSNQTSHTLKTKIQGNLISYSNSEIMKRLHNLLENIDAKKGQ